MLPTNPDELFSKLFEKRWKCRICTRHQSDAQLNPASSGKSYTSLCPDKYSGMEVCFRDKYIQGCFYLKTYSTDGLTKTFLGKGAKVFWVELSLKPDPITLQTRNILTVTIIEKQNYYYNYFK